MGFPINNLRVGTSAAEDPEEYAGEYLDDVASEEEVSEARDEGVARGYDVALNAGCGFAFDLGQRGFAAACAASDEERAGESGAELDCVEVVTAEWRKRGWR